MKTLAAALLFATTVFAQQPQQQPQPQPQPRGSDSQIAYVPPGEYTVRMKSGEFKASTKLTVEAEPGVHEGEFVAP